MPLYITIKDTTLPQSCYARGGKPRITGQTIVGQPVKEVLGARIGSGKLWLADMSRGSIKTRLPYTGVLAHDVLNRFDVVTDGHELGGLLIDGILKVVNSLNEPGTASEGPNKLHGSAEFSEGGNAQYVNVDEVKDALVSIFC